MATCVCPYFKGPDEVLDYRWDWGAWRLLPGEVIQTSTFTVSPSGTLTIDSDTFDDTSAVVWLSGGTVGTHYRVTNHVITDQGREYTWTIIILVRLK